MLEALGITGSLCQTGVKGVDLTPKGLSHQVLSPDASPALGTDRKEDHHNKVVGNPKGQDVFMMCYSFWARVAGQVFIVNSGGLARSQKSTELALSWHHKERWNQWPPLR